MIKTRHGIIKVDGSKSEILADYSVITETILMRVLDGDEEKLSDVIERAVEVAKMTDEEVAAANEGIDQLLAALEKIAKVLEGDGDDDKNFS